MRYLMTFSYDGTLFYGYQKQHNKRTVQEEIENVLNMITSSKITINASGRTDALVHALNQCAHFDLKKEIDINKFTHSLNSLLPNDIYVKSIKKVNNNFHARFNARKKQYEYKISIGNYDPITRNYIYQYNKKLNIENMKEASKYIIGEHNFKSFTKAQENKDYVRIIYDIHFTIKKDILTISFKGNGFLQYMVRNLVGTLIYVGENKIKPKDVEYILKQEDRTKAFKTAPACGLYLKKVYY